MSAELIAILAVGVGLGGLLVTLVQQMRVDLQQLRAEVRALETRVASVEQGQAKLEGLLEGLREAIAGRRVSGDAA